MSVLGAHLVVVGLWVGTLVLVVRALRMLAVTLRDKPGWDDEDAAELNALEELWRRR